MDAVLNFLDETSRSRAFKDCLVRLETAAHLDLDALRVCIKLRPPSRPISDRNCSDSHATLSRLNPPLQDAHELKASIKIDEGHLLNEKLCNILLTRIPEDHLDSDHFYNLAEILCSDGAFADVLFNERIHNELIGLLPDLDKDYEQDEDSTEAREFKRPSIRKVTAYLMLLKCSYWLPSNHNHIVNPGSLEFLSRFIGLPSLDAIIYDTVSAFLSLLKRGDPIVVVCSRDTIHPWLERASASRQVVLAKSIIDSSLWDRFSLFDPKHFMTGPTSSRIFRAWFQWISQVAVDQVELECLYDSSYWDKVRIGLLHGYADQRKYCIGIIHQSLLAAQRDIDTPAIQFRVVERGKYIKAYSQYAALFETIVLDRYSNQVLACLPELTKLFKSNITSLMTSTLLSAALNFTVQEGVRKIVGNWYIDYVVRVRGDIDGHLNFFLKGFLPWATLGELFTSTLISTREHTFSVHGASLVDVVARFVSEMPDTPRSASAASECSDATTPTRLAVVFGVLDFILDARGKIFQFSILYLLKGLIKGMRATIGGPAPSGPPSPIEIDKIIQVSHLPGLPEITSDLYGEYCCQLSNLVDPGWMYFDMPDYEQLRRQDLMLMALTEPVSNSSVAQSRISSSPPLQVLRKRLDETSHRCIQGDNYAPVCKDVVDILDRTDYTFIDQANLYAVLDALWEEADRRQFCRPVAIHVPAVLFHPTCIRTCALQQLNRSEGTVENDLQSLLTRAMDCLQRLSDGRSYILSTLGTSMRKAVFSCPDIVGILPFEDYIIRFLNNAPVIKPEFLFEVAAAEELQQYQPHRTYASYYGRREWHSYAAMIDLLQRFPKEQVSAAKRVLDRLLEPWKIQRAGIPIISKWKNVLQLQAMLLLVDFCISESEAEGYLISFRHALILEPWPRYRFLLEWTIARIYYKFPGKTSNILSDLKNVDDNTSTQIASLMKLAVLMAPHETQDFSFTFMTYLVPFSASPKVHIRHESNYAIPIIFGLALSRGWKTVTENPAFASLDAFIRRLDKFQSAPSTIRTLKLDTVKDFTLVNIFQGKYLTIESPEKERVAYEDFLALQEADQVSELSVPPERIPLGNSVGGKPVTMPSFAKATTQQTDVTSQTSPAFFQTKSGFSIDSLHGQSGPRSVQRQRPASIILVASLIDNPTNLGGLSRISESFGLEALYIDDLRKIAHKDFKATSVTSEKHLPIQELKVSGVPNFLLDMKRNGYQVVGIEQTDCSGILGAEDFGNTNAKSLGTLPKQCVLVLGSEKGGISAEVLAAVDRCVEIRTVGVTRSLNVQTAGGIAVYEWWREWYGKT